MKLTPLQKHYQDVFKSYRVLVNRHNRFCHIDQRIESNISYHSISPENDHFISLNKHAKKLLRKVGVKVLDSNNYSTKNSSINCNSHIYRMIMEMEVHGKKFKIGMQYSLTVYGFIENDELFFEDSILYKPMSDMSTVTHDMIDWDKEHTEEELFQLSCVHDMDIPFLQALHKISTALQKLNQEDNVTAINIYNALSELRIKHGNIFKRN